MRARLLGQTQITRDDGTPVDIEGKVQECLLLGVLTDAYRTNHRLLNRPEVIAALWPSVPYDPPDTSLERSLYQVIFNLRKRIGDDHVETIKGVGFRLALEPPGAEPLSVDLIDFRARAGLTAQLALQEALDLVRGDFLTEIPAIGKSTGVAGPRQRIRAEYVSIAEALTGWPAASVRTIVDDFVGAPMGTLLDVIGKADPDNLPDGEIRDRPQWSAFARKQLAPGGTRSLRMTLTGPLFLHTDAYYERLNRDPAGPHMEAELRDFLFRNAANDNADIHIIVRCTERYFASVAAHVPPERREAFTELVLGQIDALWGENGDRGPNLCCYNTGISDICAVFDDAVVVSWRSAEIREMGYPMTVNHRPEVIAVRRQRFDDTFAANSDGQQRELEKLREFVREIPTRAAHFPYLHNT